MFSCPYIIHSFSTEPLPIEVIEEHCDPDKLREVQHVSRLLTSAQKELTAQLSVCINTWSAEISSGLETDDQECSSFLSCFMRFVILHSELSVDPTCFGLTVLNLKLPL